LEKCPPPSRGKKPHLKSHTLREVMAFQRGTPLAMMDAGMRKLLDVMALVGLLSLPACPTVDLGDTPVTPPQCRPNLDMFKMEGGIWDVAINPPDMNKSCVAMEGCHAQASGRSALRFVVKPRSQMTDADWSMNLDVLSTFLDCPTPALSRFITKPE